MKKIVFACLIAFITLISCEQGTKGSFNIEANANNVSDGTKVYIKLKDTLNKVVTLDTAVVKNQKFEMHLNPGYTQLAFMIMDSVQGGLPLIIEKEGTVKLEYNKDTLYHSTYGGTLTNDEFYEVFSRANTADDSLRILSSKSAVLAQNKDTLGLQQASEKQRTIRKNVLDYNMDFIKTHTDSYVSVLLIDKLLMPGPSADAEQQNNLIELFNNLNDEVKSAPISYGLKDKIATINKTKIGSVAPEITGTTPENETLKLTEARKKVTLIDFWASWCKPCRRENPNLIKLYNAYKADGFTIYSVSTDRDEKAWRAAIKDDQLNFQLVRSEEAGRFYNIQYLPTSLIIDSEGVIIDRNKFGSDLEKAITTALGVTNKHVLGE